MRTEKPCDLPSLGEENFSVVLADPPWRFTNSTGKMAPEHKRLARYRTMTLQEIADLPVAQLTRPQGHLYLWVPNALMPEGLEVMKRWCFTYKTHLVWYKTRKDGGPDGRGVGFYFRNVTELVLFGVRGKIRTLAPGRRQVNLLATRKREHSRKPDELYDIIEKCSPGPLVELFARHWRKNWVQWGDGLVNEKKPSQPAPARLLGVRSRQADSLSPRLMIRRPARLPGFILVPRGSSFAAPAHMPLNICCPGVESVAALAR